MLPFKTMLHLDRSSRTPLYLQLSNALIKNIHAGMIQAGHKLPGSRKMAALLAINRRTVITAYEELESQGWLEIKLNSGCYVSSILPQLHPRQFADADYPMQISHTPFEFEDQFSYLSHFEPDPFRAEPLVIDAGYPDIRLAPLVSLSSNLSSLMKGKRSNRLMNYSTDFCGDLNLRTQLVQHLRASRSIQIDIDNLMITRGSLMAFFNIFQIILQTGDKVIVGVPGFQVANNIIRIAGGEILEVPVDDYGIDVDEIERTCQRERIKAVFIMPHHHNPTTVSLRADRRMKLLTLSHQYGFAIIEDDYDYDFHYNSSPILPMASLDKSGHVIYVGSLSKTIAPALRMGFIVASKELIRHVSRLSRFIDCHGNIVMERAISMLFDEGEIKRYFKKALKKYHERRDHFCQLLRKELGSAIEFDDPEGGMAAWVKFDPAISLPDLRKKSLTKGLVISKSVFHDDKNNHLNAIRMGFASLSEEEASNAIGILKKVL